MITADPRAKNPKFRLLTASGQPEEWVEEEEEEFAAAAVNNKRRSLCVSSLNSLSPTIVPAPTYFSTAKIIQLSDNSACDHAKHVRKLARKTARHIVRQEQIASYLALEKSEALYLKTRERVHFSNPISSTGEVQHELRFLILLYLDRHQP